MKIAASLLPLPVRAYTQAIVVLIATCYKRNTSQDNGGVEHTSRDSAP